MKIGKILIACLLILIGCDKSNKDILVVGISADNPPFEFIKNGEFTGFDIDIAKAIAEKLDMEIKIIDMDFASLIPALNNDQIDMAISAISITEERKKNVSFSDVYYQGYYGVLYRKNYKDFNDFNNKKIGVQLGSVWEIMMNDKKNSFSNLEIYSLNRTTALIEELKLSRIDMVVLDAEQTRNYAENNDVLDYKIFDELGAGLAIATKLNSPLLTKINSALDKIRDNKLHELKVKWFKIN